ADRTRQAGARPADGLRHDRRAAEISGRHRPYRAGRGAAHPEGNAGRDGRCGVALATISHPRDDADPEGRLADNIVHFARTLRKAGLRVGPAAVVDAIEAVLAAGIGSRDDFYWTPHSVLVTRHEDQAVFDEAFRLFWRSRELIEKMLAMFSPVAPDMREKLAPRAAESRVASALMSAQERQAQQEIPQVEVDARFTTSGNEVLRGKDFAQMTADEIAQAKAEISALRLPHDL